MNLWWKELLCCPVCGAEVKKEGNSLYCHGVRRHCFDFAAKGYVNLADSRAAGGGDDAALIAARTAFLSRDFYRPIADRVCDLLGAYAPGKTVVDAGCGEGYYTCHMARAGYRVLGLDLSKRGVGTASRAAAREGLDPLFAVAGIFKMPIATASLDAVVSLFAPVAEQEFLRVLRPGGVLITVGAGPEHLFSLKSLLYDTPYRNEVREDAPAKMELLKHERLRFPMALDGDDARHLFAMTPYYYRTAKEGVARLDAVTSLDCEADVELAVYRRPEEE